MKKWNWGRFGWVGETWLVGDVVVIVDFVVVDDAVALGWCLSAATKGKAEEKYRWAEDEDGCEKEEEDETGLVMMMMALLPL